MANQTIFKDVKAQRNLTFYQKTAIPGQVPDLDAAAGRKTLTKMKELRKREFDADISYDLNGDGAVSSKELWIASRFDKNKDGILEPEERKECLEALKNNYEVKAKYWDYDPTEHLPKSGIVSREAKMKAEDAYGMAQEAVNESLNVDGQKKSRSTRRNLTRSELLSSRRKRSREYELKQYNDYERDNVTALKQ